MGADGDESAWKKSIKFVKTGLEAGVSGIEKARPHVERAAKTSLDKTKEYAEKTTDAVAKGVHRAMGSDEYRREAEIVNQKLMEALRVLEDSIRRRDRDLAQLKDYVAQLEEQLRDSQNGK
jgi:hypothetical protein